MMSMYFCHCCFEFHEVAFATDELAFVVALVVAIAHGCVIKEELHVALGCRYHVKFGFNVNLIICTVVLHDVWNQTECRLQGTRVIGTIVDDVLQVYLDVLFHCHPACQNVLGLLDDFIFLLRGHNVGCLEGGGGDG